MGDPMPRLLRPAIPLSVKLRVLLRQLGDAFADDMIAIAQEQGSLGLLVNEKQADLARLLGCQPNEIDYDHDPALGARRKVLDKFGTHVGYEPAANDPEWIFARERKRHREKTNVRGEHGQHPDRVLIKKNRKIERREAEAAGLAKPRPKAKMRSANRWPPAGSRKINWRKS